MADMKRSKESLQSSNIGKISPDPYSYEHRISLDQDALTKMGVTETPKVGDVFHVVGEGHVHSVNSGQSLNGKSEMNVGIQMRKMGVKKQEKGTPADGAFGAVSKGIKEAE